MLDLTGCLLFLMKRAAQIVNQADNEQVQTMMNGQHCRRKAPGCVPHDIGDPGQWHCQLEGECH